ncbi:hypothetical protein Dimus_001200, partial [Dionaea muscipula]
NRAANYYDTWRIAATSTTSERHWWSARPTGEDDDHWRLAVSAAKAQRWRVKLDASAKANSDSTESRRNLTSIRLIGTGRSEYVQDSDVVSSRFQ